MHQKRIQKLVFAFFFVALLIGYRVRALDRILLAQSNHSTQSKMIDNCIACHQRNNDETVGLFAHSTHSRRSLSCKECHGGDTSSSEKQAAHSQNFIGRMNSSQILERCGTCHSAQLIAFKTSRHFREGKTVTRVDCVQCHGAHTVGKVVGDSSFAYVCAGCHGLEYLPELPAPFQKNLILTDESRDALRDLEVKGIKPSEEILKLRRELRRTLGQWVHATDAKGAQDKAAEFFEMNDRLRKQVRASAIK